MTSHGVDYLKSARNIKALSLKINCIICSQLIVLQEAKESFASPDQRFGMKTEVYFVSLRQ